MKKPLFFIYSDVIGGLSNVKGEKINGKFNYRNFKTVGTLAKSLCSKRWK